MYYDDHGIPHIHAIYPANHAKIAIETMQIIDGAMNRRAMRMIREWMGLHREELLQNWNRARRGEDMFKIDPLV